MTVITEKPGVGESAGQACVTGLIVDLFLDENIGEGAVGRNILDLELAGVVGKVGLNGVNRSFDAVNIEIEGKDLAEFKLAFTGDQKLDGFGSCGDPEMIEDFAFTINHSEAEKRDRENDQSVFES